MKSKINWSLDQIHTWNITSGCTKVSAGCANCYAERLVGTRLAHLPQNLGIVNRELTSGHLHWTGLIRCHEDKLSEPLRRKKPTTYFVCSQSDLLHPSVPSSFIQKAFDIAYETPRHTYMFLTKRPERMHIEVNLWLCRQDIMYPLPANIWLGTSVENQDAADKRIPPLLACPASKRFLSCEPLLGTVNLEVPVPGPTRNGVYPPWYIQSGIHLVIVGGESGPNARPMDLAWPRSLRDQCKEAGVPFFMKQIVENGKKIPFESFPQDLQVREWSE